MLTAGCDDGLRQTSAGFGERLAAFGPRLLAMAVVLVIGVAAAFIVRLAVPVVLAMFRFDRFAARVGVTVILRKGGITRAPSAVLATLTAWLVAGLFVLFAVAALDLQIAMDLLSRAFLYLPQVFIAAAILLLGALMAAFLRRSVIIAAVNSGLESARLLGLGAQTAVLILAVAMALEHLGVGESIILASFVIVFGGLVLALALAFGLAGRDLARTLLERLFARAASGEREPDEDIRRHL
jgi:hypothetical protein